MDAGTIAAIAAGVGTIAAGLVKVGHELGKRSKGPSMRPPAAAIMNCPVDPRHVERTYELMSATDPDGVPRVHNKPSVERDIRETLQASRETRQASREQVELLREIRDSVRTWGPPRDRMPTHPGE